MNRYLIETTQGRKFLVTADTPPEAEAQIAETREIRCGWTGAPILTEPALEIAKTERIA
jgi:hypothetical protein